MIKSEIHYLIRGYKWSNSNSIISFCKLNRKLLLREYFPHYLLDYPEVLFVEKRQDTWFFPFTDYFLFISYSLVHQFFKLWASFLGSRMHTEKWEIDWLFFIEFWKSFPVSSQSGEFFISDILLLYHGIFNFNFFSFYFCWDFTSVFDNFLKVLEHIYNSVVPLICGFTFPSFSYLY